MIDKKLMQEISLELSRAGVAKGPASRLAELDKTRITPERQLPPIDFLFRLFGVPCFPRGELCVIGGKAKSGKTLLTSMLMAAGVVGEALSLKRVGTQPLRVLWMDTEQSEQSTQEILVNRVMRMATVPDNGDACEFPMELMDVFNVRSVKVEHRLEMLVEGVRHYRPDLCIVDGVRDLVTDINDGVKAQEVVERLMQLAQETDCSLVCVIHQNKGAEDRNLRGWIGTELTNKAFEVYCCEKLMPERIFAVEQTHTRKHDIGQMLYFCVGEDGLPVACETPAAPPLPTPLRASGKKYPPMNQAYLEPYDGGQPRVKLRELFYEALKQGAMYYTDLQLRTMKLLNCQDTGFWNHIFRDAKEGGIIVNDRNQYGKSVWTLPRPRPAAEEPLPF